MATELPKTIVLKQLYGRYDEGRAAEAITPGHLVTINNASKLIKHATARGKAAPFFAKEDALQGKTIDDAYAINDLVGYHMAVAGDEIYGWLKDGESVVPGDRLSSAGDGTFQKFAAETIAASGNAETLTAEENFALVESLETVNLVGGAAAAGRVKVRVI